MTGTTVALTALSTVSAEYGQLDSSGGITLASISGDDSLDLSTVLVPVASGTITPGSLSITVVDGTVTKTITDDGAGVLTGEAGSLPGDGTIDYLTGEMTGTTAVLDGLTDVTATYTSDSGASGVGSMSLSSGAAAGEVSLSYVNNKAAGETPSELDWGFSIRFPSVFGLNNNGVSGARTLTLEARLVKALASGQDIVLRWQVATHDANPPAAWGTPVFVAPGAPASSPTAALAVAIDGSWVPVVFTRAAQKTLSVSVDGTAELFVFTHDLVVPTKVELAHIWTHPLDRSFSVDQWDFSYSLPEPPLAQ